MKVHQLLETHANILSWLDQPVRRNLGIFGFADHAKRIYDGDMGSEIASNLTIPEVRTALIKFTVAWMKQFIQQADDAKRGSDAQAIADPVYATINNDKVGKMMIAFQWRENRKNMLKLIAWLRDHGVDDPAFDRVAAFTKKYSVLEAASADLLAQVEKVVDHVVENPEHRVLGSSGLNVFPWHAYGGIPNPSDHALKSILIANKDQLAANRSKLEAPIMRFTLAWLKHYLTHAPIIQYGTGTIRRWIEFLRSNDLDFSGLQHVEKSLPPEEPQEEE